MNNLARQEPWSVMPRLQDEINRLFGTMGESDSSSATATWIPAVDIYEYDDRFELYLDVPGVNPNDVELTLENGVLALSGKRLPQGNGKQGDGPIYRRVERGQGPFYRRFVLPDTADSERVNASSSNGVLVVSIPKQPKAVPRRIQIGP